MPQYKIVVTTPGMGKDGASRTWIEHAKKNKNIMLFKVGYAPETAPMGRLGQMNVKFMETNEFGSHCTGEEMIEFLSRFECIKNVILVHGNMSTKKICRFVKHMSHLFDITSVEIPVMIILNFNYLYILNIFLLG